MTAVPISVLDSLSSLQTVSWDSSVSFHAGLLLITVGLSLCSSSPLHSIEINLETSKSRTHRNLLPTVRSYTLTYNCKKHNPSWNYCGCGSETTHCLEWVESDEVNELACRVSTVHTLSGPLSSQSPSSFVWWWLAFNYILGHLPQVYGYMCDHNSEAK